MNARSLSALALLSVVIGCSPREAPRKGSEEAAAESSGAAATSSFINKVWVVSESPPVESGDLRVFLSEGTMVMSSTHGTPSLGSWSYHDGQLTITEDGIGYAADILELTPTAFRIRIRSPGDPIVITFVPAEQAAIDGSPGASPEGRKP
jgi:hypothetical protein